MIASIVAIVAVLIAGISFVASQREFGRRAKVDYVDGLEGRISDLEEQNTVLEKRIAVCEQDRRDLRDDNFRLMSRILSLERGQP